MAETLVIEGLRAGYGEAVVLPQLSLTLAQGEAVALLGRNGTGKTTLINSIVGVTRRFAGRILLEDRDVLKEFAGDLLDGKSCPEMNKLSSQDRALLERVRTSTASFAP